MIEAFQYKGYLKDSDENGYMPMWAIKAFEDGILTYCNGMLTLLIDGYRYVVFEGEYIIKYPEGKLVNVTESDFNKWFEEIKE